MGPKTEPLGLIKAFTTSLRKKDDGRARHLLSVCTGSLFLAEAEVLDGLIAARNPKYYARLGEISSGKGKIRVMEETYVLNKPKQETKLRITTNGGVSCGMDSCW